MRRAASSARGNVATDARLCPGSVAAFVLRLEWSPVVEDHHDSVRVRMYQPPDSIDRAVRTVAMQSLVILCRDPVEGANDGRVGSTNAEANSQHASGRGRIVPTRPCKVLKW